MAWCVRDCGHIYSHTDDPFSKVSVALTFSILVPSCQERYFPTVTLYQKVVSSVTMKQVKLITQLNDVFLCMAGLPTSQSGQLPWGPRSSEAPKAPFFIVCQLICGNLMHSKR